MFRYILFYNLRTHLFRGIALVYSPTLMISMRTLRKKPNSISAQNRVLEGEDAPSWTAPPSLKSGTRAEVFRTIYTENVWGSGSGGGSSIEETREYREFLQDFLRRNHVKSVLDVGCGDWQFSRLIDWSGINYVGVDIVPSLVQLNIQRYGAKNIRFLKLDAVEDELPIADLVIIKDVLQHLSTPAALQLLAKLNGYRFQLFVNDYAKTNRDCDDGDTRPINLNAPPFNLNAKEIMKIRMKRVMLLCNK